MSATWEIREGDALERLREMSDGSVDAVVTDPPYGLGFMGKQWDAPGKSFVERRAETSNRFDHIGGNHNPANSADAARTARSENRKAQDWHEAWTREALRVLKPGGHLLAFGGTRTYHRLACAVEDAGFEIRDEVLSIFEATEAGRQFLASLTPEQIAALDKLGGGPLAWVYGSGFPKSLSVEKATRKLLEERYGEQACSCVDGGVGRAAGDDPGLASCGDDRGGRGARAVSTHSVGGTELPLDGSGVSDDGVRELRGADQPAAPGREAVETTVLRSDVRGCGAEATGLRGAAIRAGVEGHEGGSPREGQDMPGMRQDAEGERPRAACPPSQTVPAGWNESSDESGGAVRPLPSRSGGCDIGCVRLDPARREPRRLVLDDHAGRQRAMARVCSWCGLPAREWLDTLTPLGSALKPAHEPIVVARKPLAGTVAANVLTHGTGALNIAASRIPVGDRASYERNHSGDRGHSGTRSIEDRGSTDLRPGGGSAAADRWPANVVLDEETSELLDAQAGERVSGSGNKNTGNRSNGRTIGHGFGAGNGDGVGGDSGGASRFFYCAKASSAERQAGNTHPTVKPVELMRWLVRLVTPPGGLVLDPFAGSGTTGIAAMRDGFSFVGIEREADYAAIARERIRQDAPLLNIPAEAAA